MVPASAGRAIMSSMVTAPKSWRRWCGSRSELVRATQLAADQLHTATGLDSLVEVRLEDRSGLVETKHTADAIMALHSDDLEHLASVSVTVSPDRDQWIERRADARRRGEEPTDEAPRDEVRIRISKYGTTLEVTGEDRTRVEGLLARLGHSLSHAATNSPGIDRFLLLTPIGLSFSLVPIGAERLAWSLGFASQNGRWEVAEVVFMILGGLLFAVPFVAAWWLFPPVEIFDDGGAGRARRFRAAIIASVGAIVLGVAASIVYDSVR